TRKASSSRSSTGSVATHRLLPSSCGGSLSLPGRLRHTAMSSCSRSSSHDAVAHVPPVSPALSADASVPLRTGGR
ncbi:hypothetical protein OH76DRAFT_1413198, partial [Lentinus brumalis]